MTHHTRGWVVIFASLFLTLLSTTALGLPYYHNPALAFDSQNDRFLVVVTKEPTNANFEVWQQLLNRDGSVFTGLTSIAPQANGAPLSAAYDDASKRFLLAWDTPAHNVIYGQLFNADGSPFYADPNQTAFLQLSDIGTAMYEPFVASDSINKRFLVVWFDGPDHKLLGTLINADGSIWKKNILIYDFGSDIGDVPSAAFDDVNQRFLVVWQHNVSGKTTIHSRIMSADGVVGTDADITPLGGDNDDGPRAAFDRNNSTYLVTWINGTGSYDVRATTVDANGTPSAQGFMTIATGTTPFYYYYRSAPVVFDADIQQFLIAWSDTNASTGHDQIYGLYVKSDRSVDAAGKSVLDAKDNADLGNPGLIFNSDCSNFLLATVDGSYMPRYTVVGSPCDAAPPTVVSVTPTDGATGIAVDTAITVTFDGPMMPSSINASTFTLSGGVTGTVTLSDDKLTATFKPGANFAYSTPYAATVSTGVKDRAANAMAANYTWSFATAAASAGGGGDGGGGGSGGGCSLIPRK